jgi:flagellar basal-body rod modification protein FlgD
MTPSSTIPSAPGATQTAGSTLPSTLNKSVNKETFLQLLVAQLKNQNPLSPSDGAQFISQLAGFTQLEQTINMSQELEGIHKDLNDLLSKQTQATPPS